ncbi:QVR superfamily protein crim [Aphomia sociella]
MKYIFLLLLSASAFYDCLAIWCYQCSSATPGCSEPFNWRGVGYLGNPCPDSEDVCIKLIERKGAETVITRDCLSNFRAFRTDIPADTYEGCRPAAKDVNLANYVNNTIKELDLKRNWYDETTWCFCFLDHRCNGALNGSASIALLMLTGVVLLFTKILF